RRPMSRQWQGKTFASSQPPSARRHVDGFDDVAQISGGIPSWLERLHLAAIAGGARFQAVVAGGQPDRPLPLAAPIVAEILAEPGRRPGLAVIDGDCDLLDALAAVEGDAPECYVPAGLDLGVVLHAGDERAHGETIDRDRGLRRGAGLDAIAVIVR